MARFSWPVKWLLAPALAAAVGYALIGPRLAGKVKLPEAVKKGVGKFVPVGDSGETPPETKETSPESAPPPPPSVTTGAEPMASEEPKPRRRRRRHRDEE